MIVKIDNLRNTVNIARFSVLADNMPKNIFAEFKIQSKAISFPGF